MVRSREAALAMPNEKFVPIDLALVGIVDELEVKPDGSFDFICATERIGLRKIQPRWLSRVERFAKPISKPTSNENTLLTGGLDTPSNCIRATRHTKASEIL